MQDNKLPTKVTQGEAVKLNELVWFVYGPPGIGKSTLASGFGPTPLFLWTSSVKYLTAYKNRIGSWKDFTRAVKGLQKLDGKRYSAVVIDTIDLLWMLCRGHVLSKRGIEHETDLSHGKGFDMVRREFIPEIAKVSTCGYGLVFVSHAKVRDVTVGRGVRSDRIVPTLQDSAKNIVLPLCDIEAYMGFSAQDIDEDTGKRKIFFQPTGIIEAKDWTDTLPNSMTVDRDPKKTVRLLEAYLSGKKKKGDATTRGGKTRRTTRKKTKAARRRT
jgi:hypothetical protein